LASRAALISAWMPFIAPRSSTVPFSQVAMMRRRDSPPTVMSMKVRRQLFTQKRQRVSSPTVVLYSISRTASRPMKVVLRPRSQSDIASKAAPMAPASPACLWTVISGALPVPLKRSLMKSTCAFTAARLFCVPPCRMKRVPSSARLGILAM